MPRFHFEAINLDGVALTGEISAPTERDALRQMEKRQLAVVALTETRLATPTGRRARKLGQAELILCLHELATMLNSGVTLGEAVAAQGRSSHHPQLAAAFETMSAALARGQAFSEALANAGLPLPDYVRTLAQAGEQSGLLGQALRDGVTQMSFDHAISGEVRQALTYPTVLVVAGVGAIALMFTFVVPKFSGLLARVDDLPLISWLVLATGTFVRDHFAWLALALAVAVALGMRALANPEARARLQERLEQLPVVGLWRVESEAARWAKVLSTLLANKVPLMQAMALAQSAVHSPQRRAKLDEVARAVRAGASLADALESQAALTPTGYNLVRVGERAGELPAMLRSLGELCDQAGKARMKQLLALLEPIAILVIGVTIGIIMIGIILAITSANDIILK